MIRRATQTDIGALAELYLAARKRHLNYAPLNLPDNDVREWFKSSLIQQHGVLVKEENGVICAMLAFCVKDGFSWIEQLYVDPDKTGQGHGSDLLRFAQKLLPPPIRLYTFQQNTGSRQFYERAKFIALHFSDGSRNAERCPDILYEWRP